VGRNVGNRKPLNCFNAKSQRVEGAKEETENCDGFTRLQDFQDWWDLWGYRRAVDFENSFVVLKVINPDIVSLRILEAVF
jgi:hypothetical protein